MPNIKPNKVTLIRNALLFKKNTPPVAKFQQTALKKHYRYLEFCITIVSNFYEMQHSDKRIGQWQLNNFLHYLIYNNFKTLAL